MIFIKRNANRWTAMAKFPDGFTSVGTAKVGLGNDAETMVIDGHSFNYAHFKTVAGALSDTLYIGPYRNVVSAVTDEYFDLKVGYAFVGLWKELQTGRTKADRDTAHRIVDALKRVFEFSDLQITASSDSQALLVSIDGRSYELSDVGAGLAQFIISLTYAATKK